MSPSDARARARAEITGRKRFEPNLGESRDSRNTAALEEIAIQLGRINETLETFAMTSMMGAFSGIGSKIAEYLKNPPAAPASAEEGKEGTCAPK